MLRNEIEPFANQQIIDLGFVSGVLDAELVVEKNPVIREQLLDSKKILENARQAFVRFKICMADEVDQKQRLQQKLREH